MSSKTIDSFNENTEISEERKQIAKLLYVFAWIIEVCAVLIGLGIAIMQGVASFTEMNEFRGGALNIGDYTNIFIAMMPFFMVALIEITKIPFVGAYYKTTWRAYKYVFLICLLFLATITFESAFNGFERNFNSLMFSINKNMDELVGVEERIANREAHNDKLQELTSENIEAAYNERHKTISSERDTQVSDINNRIADLRRSTQTEYILGLKDQVEIKREEISVLNMERSKELERVYALSASAQEKASEERSENRRLQMSRVNDLKSDIRSLRSEKRSAMDQANIFTRGGVEEEYNQRIANAESDLKNLLNQIERMTEQTPSSLVQDNYASRIESIKNDYARKIAAKTRELNDLLQEISRSVGSSEQANKVTIDNYLNEIKSIEESFKSQQEQNLAYRDRQLEELSRREASIGKNNNDIQSLTNRKEELRDIINERVGNNQVYRMAKQWYGVNSAADITRDQASIIALVWFGSLALLVAITGIMLAWASYVIGDSNIPNTLSEEENKRGLRSTLRNTINSFRRYLIYRRRLLRKPMIKEVPKEVIREVPVEKVVKTEVPVEIIKKEFVHIPMYTEDKSLLNKKD